jgi:flagellar motor switch protein FliM
MVTTNPNTEIQFQSGHREFFLELSDRLSTILETNIDFKEFEIQSVPYKSISDSVRNNASIIGLFKLEKRGVLVVIQTSVVTAVSDLFFGKKNPKGVAIAGKNNPPFSVRFTGNYLTQFFQRLFDSLSIAAAFDRDETEIDLIHYFYPDDRVRVVQINSKIFGNLVGTIQIIYPDTISEIARA